MIALLETNRKKLIQLCHNYHVVRLEVFGSAARGNDFSSTSDIDFIVQFTKHPTINRFYQYFDFKDALENLLGHNVDLLEAGAIENPYFLRAIEVERELMYAA